MRDHVGPRLRAAEFTLPTKPAEEPRKSHLHARRYGTQRFRCDTAQLSVHAWLCVSLSSLTTAWRSGNAVDLHFVRLGLRTAGIVDQQTEARGNDDQAGLVGLLAGQRVCP